MERNEELAEFERQWKAPRELTRALPRDVGLTKGGMVLTVLAVVFLIGAVVAAVGLGSKATRESAERRLPGRTGSPGGRGDHAAVAPVGQRGVADGGLRVHAQRHRSTAIPPAPRGRCGGRCPRDRRWRSASCPNTRRTTCRWTGKATGRCPRRYRSSHL